MLDAAYTTLTLTSSSTELGPTLNVPLIVLGKVAQLRLCSLDLSGPDTRVETCSQLCRAQWLCGQKRWRIPEAEDDAGNLVLASLDLYFRTHA